MNRRLSGPALMLLELTLVSLIFCLSSAVCAMLFARAATLSAGSAATTGAVFAAESAAECFKAESRQERLAELLGGTLEEGTVISLNYDEAWAQQPEGRYVLTVRLEDEGALTRAHIRVTDGAQELFSLDVARYEEGRP